MFKPKTELLTLALTSSAWRTNAVKQAYVRPDGTVSHGGGGGRCTEGTCDNGQGAFEYNDGSRYVGQWKAGKMQWRFRLLTSM